MVETTDPDSTAVSDTEVILTPVEYGNVITTTSLAELQTGGRASMAAMQLIAGNMAETMDVLGVRALEASTNVQYVGQTSRAAITATDIMARTNLGAIYNKLSRASVPKHSLTGTYIMMAHDDVIHDLREESSAGSWEDVNKYNNQFEVLNNEVGMYKGFRILRNNHSLLVTDGGVTTTDVYKSSFIGFNALGKAESQVPQIVVSGPFDKLGRFLNIGWKATTAYKIIESTAVWSVESASSVGVNV